ncbi:MAG: hypothetical protein WA880_16830 [Ornithinimicrobium sp.]
MVRRGKPVRESIRQIADNGDTSVLVSDQTRTYNLNAYDAGSDINTEKFADIVPPCQGLIGETGSAGTGTSNPDLAEHGVVRRHRGITGTDDGLNAAIHGWDESVGQVIITRID